MTTFYQITLRGYYKNSKSAEFKESAEIFRSYTAAAEAVRGMIDSCNKNEAGDTYDFFRIHELHCKE